MSLSKWKLGYDISRGIKPEPCPQDSDNVYHKKLEIDEVDTKMKGIELGFLAVGGMVGTFLRYRMALSPLILGTLSVNVLIINMIGSFILGVFVVLSQQWNLDAKYTLLVAIGFCGSLTTMSSFALETSNLIDNKLYSLVAINIVANVGLSLGAIFGGKTLMSVIMSVGLR